MSPEPQYQRPPKPRPWRGGTIGRAEAIGPAYADRLREAGVGTLDALLDKGATRAERARLAEDTGISSELILRWVNTADLFRVKGIGEEYASLLEAAGVDSTVELAQSNPHSLVSLFQKVNQEKNLVRRLPAIAQVAAWVEQARQLPRIITY